MKIAVASGKGGTGKTTLAVNLALAANGAAQLLDCDVEAPNVHLFLNGRIQSERVVTIPIPEIDAARCNGCNECSEFCKYNAIASFGACPTSWRNCATVAAGACAFAGGKPFAKFPSASASLKLCNAAQSRLCKAVSTWGCRSRRPSSTPSRRKRKATSSSWMRRPEHRVPSSPPCAGRILSCW